MRLIFAGTPDFAARSLAGLHNAGHEITLVLTQPDRPAGRGLKSAPSAVKVLALELGLEVFQPAGLKDPEAQQRLSASRADLMVVAAYGLILPEPVLAMTRFGAINVHASLLPRWRGAAPIQRAILAGDTTTGISIMQMDRGLDTGPILAAESLPIKKEDTAASLHAKLAELGARLIVDSLSRLELGQLRAEPQADAGASYATKITKAEAEIDWREPAIRIERKVRAFDPLPGASTTIRNIGLKVWSAQTAKAEGVPGTILEVTPAGILIACGAEALFVSELQRAGGKRLRAAQFLTGFPLAPGEQLEFSARTTI